MRFLYSLAIHLFGFLVSIAALFNPKAKLWHEGRKDEFDRLKKTIGPNDRVIWFHCASLGEFEQGRPVIEAMKNKFSNHKILLTFFSPSGFEKRKNYKGANFVFYLPLDTRKNAKQFLSIANPQLVFFIKYEFWFNYLDLLHQNKIPVYFVSTIFRPAQYFFKPWGGWIRKQLRKVTHFFVQDEESLQLLKSIKINDASVSGDTRFDRVIKLKEEEIRFPVVDAFGQTTILLVAGSTWPADENILLSLMDGSKKDFKLIIAPHEVNKERIDQIEKKFIDYRPILFSDPQSMSNNNSRVMIIDSIGQLSFIYRYAKVAYIGGGFGTGIHNILEAATYGVPIIHGPNYKRFREAVDLEILGGSFVVDDSAQCKEVFEKLLDEQKKYNRATETNLSYVCDQAGATLKVLEKANEFLSRD